MAETGGEQSANTWPMVKFMFSVTIGSDAILFQEVTGLSSETQVIEYRVGNSKAFSTVKMPGLQKFGNVTLKKGTFKGDTKLWDMYNKLKANVIERVAVVINLLDEKGDVAMTWKLANAFPAKINVTDMKADGSEIAVESIELAHEGLTLIAK